MKLENICRIDDSKEVVSYGRELLANYFSRGFTCG